jgi:hypothetical protein
MGHDKDAAPAEGGDVGGADISDHSPGRRLADVPRAGAAFPMPRAAVDRRDVDSAAWFSIGERVIFSDGAFAFDLAIAKRKGLFSSGFVMKDEHGFGFYVE